jgi:hypothetical protein
LSNWFWMNHGLSMDYLMLQHVLVRFIASLHLKNPLGLSAKSDPINHQRSWIIYWDYCGIPLTRFLKIAACGWNIYIAHVTMIKIKSHSRQNRWVHWSILISWIYWYMNLYWYHG